MMTRISEANLKEKLGGIKKIIHSFIKIFNPLYFAHM